MKKSNVVKIGLLCAGIAVVAAGIFLFVSRASQKIVEEGEIYYVQGHLTKMETPLNEKMIEHASNRFSYINENYLAPEGITPYLAIIPDKNYYLTQDEQSRALDYDALISKVIRDNPYMEYIDITDLLSLDDFYITDSHWRQENITDIADRIAAAMDVSLVDDYELCRLEEPFYGVYYEDGEDRVQADTIYYLDSETIRGCTVSAVGEEKNPAIYDLENGKKESPYDMFLSGAVAILTIENPNASNDRSLIVFRDSFGSSFVPLLISGYKNITMIDIRYVQSQALGQFVDFSDSDVLFLYSTLLLNNSMGMK